MSKPNQHTAAFSEAFFMANLLFVGIFYLALWVLYLLRYQGANTIEKQHLKQALLASSISTSIFIGLNVFIILSSGYASVTALFSLEFYFMVIVPLFLAVGIPAFIKAIKDEPFTFPLLGRFIETK